MALTEPSGLAPADGVGAEGQARFEAFRRQESGLILLNLAILAGILLVHVLLMPALGHPSRLFFLVLGGRFLMQTVELLVLQGGRHPWSPSAIYVYERFSIWANVAFAFLLSVLGGLSGMQDAHYIVLMVVPLVAAAFRFGPWGVSAVAGTAGLMTIAEVWIYFRLHPPPEASEYVEAANTALFYLVVVVIAWFLVRQLSREQRRLRASLDELQRTRDRLVQEEKLSAVGRLAGAIAHEIRNPVSMIVSSLALARKGELERFEKEGMCEIVVSEADRLERLVSDFLAYARVKEPEKGEASLQTTIGYVAGLARARAQELGLVLTVDAPEESRVTMDPFQVHQALLNLVTNAFDATPRGGEVCLGAAPLGGGGASLWVENSAGPIPEEAAARVFEPFFTTKSQGTGLGLSIGRAIALAHGGSLELKANEPGRVRFVLTLPGPER